MDEATPILAEPRPADPRRRQTTEELFTQLYDELRRLASNKIAHEAPGQTLQATSLVHEAFLRLGGGKSASGGAVAPQWDSRNHFFCAAAEAMRRILVDNARRRRRQKRGGNAAREALSSLDESLLNHAETEVPDRLLDVHDALTRLEAANPMAAQVVKLRYFVGFTNQETAEIMEISPRKVNQLWAYARAWLLEAIADQ